MVVARTDEKEIVTLRISISAVLAVVAVTAIQTQISSAQEEYACDEKEAIASGEPQPRHTNFILEEYEPYGELGTGAIEGHASPAHTFCHVPQKPPRPRAETKAAAMPYSLGRQYLANLARRLCAVAASVSLGLARAIGYGSGLGAGRH